MDSWLLPAIGFLAYVALTVFVRRLFWRRWLADGMSPTRAALLSLAITYLPVLALLFVGGLVTGRPMPLETWLVLVLAMTIPILLGFGLRRAVFDYMDRHGVRDELKRRR